MAVLLEAQKLDKAYTLGKGNIYRALTNISLNIEEGEFVCIMGPSGSGKSTLLYCVSGMDNISGGSVAFAGKKLESLTEKELAHLRLTKMGFVFQHGNLLKNLSIFDNIVVPAYLRGREKRSAVDGRAVSIMEQTGILYLKDHDISQVSGGELQRASICRALINEPAILFADEPTGALNSSSANEIMGIFNAINTKGGTILLVTHDAKVAARGDRVLFMLDGVIKDEYIMERYCAGESDLKTREAALSEWLSTQGF